MSITLTNQANFPTSITIGDVVLLPCDRTAIRALRATLIHLQSYWLEQKFSTGETVADEDCWGLMQSIIYQLPRQDNPATHGCDLTAHGNDYALLERLFFCESRGFLGGGQWGDAAQLDLDLFVPGAIASLHRLNANVLLLEADQMRLKRLLPAETEATAS